jgi:hypothetical protein
MPDITNPKLIFAKGFLFLFAGLMAATIILMEHPTLRMALLLAIAVWCIARFYYFAFYVIEHYVDSEYRYAGLWLFVQYAMRKRKDAS